MGLFCLPNINIMKHPGLADALLFPYSLSFLQEVNSPSQWQFRYWKISCMYCGLKSDTGRTPVERSKVQSTVRKTDFICLWQRTFKRNHFWKMSWMSCSSCLLLVLLLDERWSSVIHSSVGNLSLSYWYLCWNRFSFMFSSSALSLHTQALSCLPKLGV